MPEIQFACEECGGTGVDPGSLNDPEPCAVCLGSGSLSTEIDPRSSDDEMRKPMCRALPKPVTAGKLVERQFRLGGVN